MMPDLACGPPADEQNGAPCPSATAEVDALAGEFSRQYIRGWDSDIIVTPELEPETEPATSSDDRIHLRTPSNLQSANPQSENPTSHSPMINADDPNAPITPGSPLAAGPSTESSLLDCYVAFRHARAGCVPASSAMSLASSGVRKNCGGLPLRFRHARDVAHSSPNLVRNRVRMRRREPKNKTSSKSGSPARSVAGESEGSVASFELMCES